MELVAFGGRDGPSGSLSLHGTYVELGGRVACVTVRGANAWVAGVIEWGDVDFDGWVVRVTDHGVRDQAVTFMDDYGTALPGAKARARSSTPSTCGRVRG